MARLRCRFGFEQAQPKDGGHLEGLSDGGSHFAFLDAEREAARNPGALGDIGVRDDPFDARTTDHQPKKL
ncbi:MAG: hypothetical protein OXI01_01915 [Albidovulum sp.]|nr:hypothetical protein [Albidovulum sp.]